MRIVSTTTSVHWLGYDLFEWDRSWCVDEPLDHDAMESAGRVLLGRHDFTSFRSAGCQRASPIMTLQDLQIHTQRPTLVGPSSDDDSVILVTIRLTADSFLYRQVRNIVGCLVQVGRGRWSVDDVRQLLAARDRTQAPSMAPAHGLFLIDVQHGDFSI